MKKKLLLHILFLGILGICLLIIDFLVINQLQLQQLWVFTGVTFFVSVLILILLLLRIRMHKNEEIDDYRRHAKLNRILYELVHSTSTMTTRSDLYKEILTKLIEAIPNASKGSVLILEKENILKYQAVIGYDEEALKDTFLLLEQSFIYLKTNGHVDHTVVIYDPFEYDRQNVKTENMEKIIEVSPFSILSTLSTPILINGELYGMINVDSEIRNAFIQQDIKTIEIFANEIAHVIKLYDTLEHNYFLLNRDVLTGLYNRRYFNKFLKERLAVATEQTVFSIVSFDLNNLKKVNDQYGHDCGDLLIIQFAEGMNKFINSEDILARYGGDEFLLLTSVEDEFGLKDFLQAIIEYFDAIEIPMEQDFVKISFSYGVASYPKDGRTIEALIKYADSEMYTRKRNHHLMEK
ncbi:MAG: sensor domain-containing diguanylate cyclase [Vallitaleaceae bacterium]|nr:sensor domain-containing diguanylate cyclase [Vallitaleaceae bacterium]